MVNGSGKGRMGPQSLWLRTEQECAPLIAIIEGLLAQTVARKVEFAIRCVPNRKSEHTDETFQGFDKAPFAERRQHHFCIASATKMMAESLELRPEKPMIVDLA